MAGTPQYEDQIIRNVFAISLREQDADGTANPPVICLQGLAQVSVIIRASLMPLTLQSI